MEKLVYLLREPTDTSGASLRARVLAAAAALRDGGAMHVAANVSDEDVAGGERVTIGRLDPPIRGMLSFWMHNSDDRAVAEAAIRAVTPAIAGYLVVESVPLANPHVAAPGTRSAGVNMVTCIHRLPAISREEFWRLWYDEHKQVALETQATFGYVRNTVVRPLTGDAPPCDGIVEEMFPIAALTDPMAWYAAASEDDLRARLGRMMASVQRFLDFTPLESHPMSHYAM